MLSRHGQAEMVDWLPRLLLLLVAVLLIGIVVRSYANRDVDSGTTRIAAYLARVERDAALYLWEDPSTGRATPGSIDAEKLVGGRLDAFFGIHGTIGSAVTVTSDCLGQPFTDMNDRATYDLYAPVALAGLKGKGGAAIEQHVLPVTVIAQGRRCDGLMNVSVVAPVVARKVAP